MAINLNVGGNTDPLEAAVRAAVDRIRRQPIKITVDDKGVTQPLGNMKRGADEFNKSMEAANARIIAFGASMAILNGISESFKQMVRNLVEVEKALQDINVVMGLSVDNLNRFSSGLFKVAKETGAAFNIAAEAATEYARQGLSMEESLKRTRDALILTRLTGMDSANAVKALTAAMNTYGHQIKDTTELVSKFAAVDVKFAVSAEDFADAISRTGAAAKGAGVSIDELIGIVTAAQQQTARGGKVIGNSLKTIFTRIGKTSTLNQLEQVGIAVRDLEGNTIGAKKILTDLANTFDKLSAAQQAQVTQSVGGVFQINILKAVLSDAAKQNGIMAQATAIASGATDEAIQKNEMLRQTMAALASETGMALKEVSAAIGEIMLAPGIEKILNTVKGIAEGITGMLGDGEEEGNRFAKGVLSGLGNILTGPGLVILTVVFGKLFFKAFQYGKDSLKSLIGVTTEKQKQAAIQQALVDLFGRASELNKEMLRTDIDIVQKEKTILSLLREQTKEANLLNAVSKDAAKTLFAAGYKSNLSKKTNASGHVPNFSEREQAAKGGYAAGNIRTMNMPGQGTVIYNSAETVKNFAGMKQPGILPPKGSKAGKNYREGFGGIHGFDPYAAGGYVPNFKKEGLASPRGKKSEKWDSSKKVIDATQYATMLIPSVFPDTVAMTEGGKNVTMGDLEKKKSLTRLGIGHSAIKGPGSKVYGLNLDRSVKYNLRGLDPGKVDGQKMGWSTDSIIKGLQTQGYAGLGASIGNSLKLGNVPGISDKDIIQAMNDPTSGAKGAINSVAGAIFEGALNKRLNIKGGAAAKSKSGLIMGGDFDVRHLDATAHKHLESLFGSGIAPLADYKNSASDDNRKSFAKKILQDMVHKKSSLLSLPKGSLKESGGAMKWKAGGFVPSYNMQKMYAAEGNFLTPGTPVKFNIGGGPHAGLTGKIISNRMFSPQMQKQMEINREVRVRLDDGKVIVGKRNQLSRVSRMGGVDEESRGQKGVRGQGSQRLDDQSMDPFASSGDPSLWGGSTWARGFVPNYAAGDAMWGLKVHKKNAHEPGAVWTAVVPGKDANEAMARFFFKYPAYKGSHNVRPEGQWPSASMMDWGPAPNTPGMQWTSTKPYEKKYNLSLESMGGTSSGGLSGFSGNSSGRRGRASMFGGGYIPNFANIKLPKGTTTGSRNLQSHGKKGGAGGVPAWFKKKWAQTPDLAKAVLQGAGTIGTGFMAPWALFPTLTALAGYGIYKTLKKQGKDGQVLKAMKVKGAPMLAPGFDANLMGRLQPGMGVNALGFIPNYADPLSDAIGRERGAGVPVSKIRVGQHPSLMGASNPMGFGVTNTKDEPRGLTDIFGANGTIPNYAMSDSLRQTWDFITSKSKQILSDKQKEWVSSDAMQKKSRAQQLQMISVRQKSTNAAIQMTREESVEALKQLEFSKEETVQAMKQKNLMDGASEGDIGDMFGATDDEGAVSGGLGGWVKGKAGKLDKWAKKTKVGGMAHKLGGKMTSGMGGMAMMMGAPMVAGMITEGNETSMGAQATGGTLSGAGTGASMGMMFGPWGAAIGAAGGALMGLVGGIQDADKASRDAADAIRKETHERDKANRGQMFGGLADKLYGKASVASFNANRRIAGEASGAKFSGKLTGTQASTAWMGDKLGGVLTSVPEMIRDLGDDSTDFVDDALQGVFEGNFGAKGKVAAKKLGLVGGTFGDTVEFTRENEGDWLDYSDHDAASSLVAADILNKQISAGGGELSGGRGSTHMLDMSAEELSGYQEDLRAALIVALGDEGLGKMAQNAKTSASFMEAFSSDLEKAGIKEAPKNLADAVANFAFVDFSEGTEGEINRKLGTAGSVIDDYINSLDDNVEMQMNIGGEMKVVNKRILLEEHQKAKKSKTEVELYGAIGDELAKRRQAAKAQRAAAIKALNFQKIQVQLQSTLNKHIMGLSHAYKMSSLELGLRHAKMGNSLDKGTKIIDQANSQRRGIMVDQQKEIAGNKNKFRSSAVNMMKDDNVYLKIRALMAGGQGDIAKSLKGKGGFDNLLSQTGENKTGSDFALALKGLSSAKTKEFLDSMLESEHITSKMRLELEAINEALESGNEQAKQQAINKLRQLDITTDTLLVELEIQRIRKLGAEDLVLRNLQLQNHERQEALRLTIELNQIKASTGGRVLGEGESIEKAKESLRARQRDKELAQDRATAKKIRDVLKATMSDQNWSAKRQGEALESIADEVKAGDFEGVRQSIRDLTTSTKTGPKTLALQLAKTSKLAAKAGGSTGYKGAAGHIPIQPVHQPKLTAKELQENQSARSLGQPVPHKVTPQLQAAPAGFKGSPQILDERRVGLDLIQDQKQRVKSHQEFLDRTGEFGAANNRLKKSLMDTVIKQIDALETGLLLKKMGMDPLTNLQDLSVEDTEKFKTAQNRKMLKDLGYSVGQSIDLRNPSQGLVGPKGIKPTNPQNIAPVPRQWRNTVSQEKENVKWASSPAGEAAKRDWQEQRAQRFIGAKAGSDEDEIFHKIVAPTQAYKALEKERDDALAALSTKKMNLVAAERYQMGRKVPHGQPIAFQGTPFQSIPRTEREEGLMSLSPVATGSWSKKQAEDSNKARLTEIKAIEEAEAKVLSHYEEQKGILDEQLDAHDRRITSAQTAADSETYINRLKNITNEKIKEIIANREEEVNLGDILLAQQIKEAELMRKRKMGLDGKSAWREALVDLRGGMQNELDYFEYNLTQNVAGKFKDGMVDAIQAAINKSEDLGDSLRNLAIDLLGMIQKAFLQRAVGMMMTPLFGAMGMSSGGQVPARVSNGEYVMSRGAVNRYGGGFMHGLNARGKVPGYAHGGEHKNEPGSALATGFGGGEGWESGNLYQKKAMSGFFYSGASGNQLLGEDTSTAKGILAERERKRQEKKAKKRAMMQMLISTVLTAGLTYGMGQMFGGAGPMADFEGGVPGSYNAAEAAYFPRAQLDALGTPSSSITPWSRGGVIRKYAPGGYISGRSGIDQIPAMLSEGEYVIKQSSVQRLGRPLLDRINAGKFADGGPTSPIAEQSETSATGGGNTNNINISVNVAKGGEKKDNADTTGESPSDTVEENKKNKALAEKLRSEVVTIIVEEQRPGGLLDA